MYQFELKPFSRNWSPALELDKEVEKIFDVFNKAGATYSPACEIVDEEKFFTISMDVPGLSQDDLDIEVKDNHLYVRGERKTQASNVVRTEKRYGKFSRAFTLPQNVNTDAIEAHFENGVLLLTLPKEEKAQPKKISISVQKKEDFSSDLKS